MAEASKKLQINLNSCRIISTFIEILKIILIIHKEGEML